MITRLTVPAPCMTEATLIKVSEHLRGHLVLMLADCSSPRPPGSNQLREKWNGGADSDLMGASLRAREIPARPVLSRRLAQLFSRIKFGGSSHGFEPRSRSTPREVRSWELFSVSMTQHNGRTAAGVTPQWGLMCRCVTPSRGTTTGR